jgi:hypothetical protein
MIFAQVKLPTELKANSLIRNIDNKLNELVMRGGSEAADQSLFVLSLLNTFKKDPETDIKVRKSNFMRFISP